MASLLIYNAKISMADTEQSEVTAVLLRKGLIEKTGTDAEVMQYRDSETTVIDAGGRRMIPGLNDSHTHLIRGGLSYNMELRWENVTSVADAIEMLRAQAAVTPAPQWVRVVGGWSEYQFAERRQPTLEEINAVSGDVPVFVLHLYSSALLNRAALRVLGIGPQSANPPGGTIVKDTDGNPTGLLLAQPSALILYSTLAQGPKLPLEDQINSTRHFMRELNRLGVTSVNDAGGGGQNYPEDYEVVERLHADGQLTVRIAYNLFAQKPGEELTDYERWVEMTQAGAGDAMLRMNGAGENLAWSAADFENFLEPRPDLAPTMEAELEKVVELLADNEWPFRIHATYDESIDRFLSVFERVNGSIPFRTRFIIDHAETISTRNIERVKALGGGIATQHRMAFQGEYFVQRYGQEAANATPPVREMLDLGVPVGGGTDATRVASYDPWVAIYWLTTGRTIGGFPLYDEQHCLTREEALHIWTLGSAWFSGEQDRKGRIAAGQYADLALLSADMMAVPEEALRSIKSVLTVVGGDIVYASDEFAGHDRPPPPPSPDWSVNRTFPSPAERPRPPAPRACSESCASACSLHGHHHHIAWDNPIPVQDKNAFWGALGCSCFAF